VCEFVNYVYVYNYYIKTLKQLHTSGRIAETYDAKNKDIIIILIF